MKFILLDRNEKYVGNLKEIITTRQQEELNGKKLLKLTVSSKDTFAEQIEKNGRILYQDIVGEWNEYIIKEIVESHDNDIDIELYCEDCSYELWTEFIEDKRPRNTTANIALENALVGTRFEVGIVEDLGLSSANFYRCEVKEAINQILEAWKCEIKIRIEVVGNKVTHRYIDLLKRRGSYKGKRYEYTRDLLSVVKTIHSDEIITALYGYGKGEQIGDGYGRRINFSGVEWSKASGDPLDKPVGKSFIADPDVLAEWGRPDGNGGKAHRYGKVEFDDCEDVNELLELTYNEYKQRSKPLVSYQIKVANVKDLESAELGDDIIVIDKEYNPELRVMARVVAIDRDPFEPSNDEFVVANFIDDITTRMVEDKKYIDSMRSKSGAWDKADFFDPDGLPSQYLKGIIEELNQKMNETGGYTYFRAGKGIEVLDKPEDQNPTSSIVIGGGYIAIASSKDINGDWDYETFGTGEGFTANLIRTGLLQGGKVKFDLDNGTLMIGNSIDDYSLLFDGTNLTLNLSSLKINAIPVATQDDIEDIDNRFTEVENTVGDKADNTIVEEVIDEVENLKGQVSNSAPKGQLIDLANEYALMKENYELSKTETENSLAELRGDSANITVNLQGATKITEFLNTFIHESNRGMFIGSKDENDGILISPKKISFMSDTHETASIEGNLMVINYGIFVKSIQVGRHAQTTNDNGVTIFTYVREV